MTKNLLIFDCDGVLADTERDGHQVAFNAMFDEVGVPLHWSDDEYAELVKIGGGKERLASVMTPELRAQLGVSQDDERLRQMLASWHQIKTRIYKELVAGGALPGRPGIRRLIAEADANGWAIAVCSTSARESVAAVLEHAVGAELAQHVQIFAGDIVLHKKPAPDIYLLALRTLGADAQNTVVVEDSGIGCQSAVAAGLATIVTVSAYTTNDDFDGAVLVLSDLGEPGHPMDILENPRGIPTGDFVDLSLLNRVLRP